MPATLHSSSPCKRHTKANQHRKSIEETHLNHRKRNKQGKQKETAAFSYRDHPCSRYNSSSAVFVGNTTQPNPAVNTSSQPSQFHASRTPLFQQTARNMLYCLYQDHIRVVDPRKRMRGQLKGVYQKNSAPAYMQDKSHAMLKQRASKKSNNSDRYNST